MPTRGSSLSSQSRMPKKMLEHRRGVLVYMRRRSELLWELETLPRGHPDAPQPMYSPRVQGPHALDRPATSHRSGRKCLMDWTFLICCKALELVYVNVCVCVLFSPSHAPLLSEILHESAEAQRACTMYEYGLGLGVAAHSSLKGSPAFFHGSLRRFGP